MSENQKSRMPWWIWIAVFILLRLSSEYSIFFLYTHGMADVYLTLSVGLILIYWLGPRVLILVYLNAFINSYYWDHEPLFSWLFFGIPETTFVFLSWYLFIKMSKGQYWLPNLANVVKFIILGICIPLTIQIFLLKIILIKFGELDAGELWPSFLNSWIGDFMPTVVVTLPFLYYLSTPFNRWKRSSTEFMDRLVAHKFNYFYIEMFAIFSIIVLLSLIIDFTKFWYIFGLISLIASVRYGFGPTTLINLLILITTYFIPASIFRQATSLYFNHNELIEIYLGVNLLSLFSIICGRVISDNWQVQFNIQHQIRKVEKINKELDSFVYSVSHDLSAPLKSIKGLTYLMRLDNNPNRNFEYAIKIEESANKLDQFIGEILDYSKNSRIEVSGSKVDLELLINDIISNHSFIDGFDNLKFDVSNLEVKILTVDEMRMKVILNNLISNAIKFNNGGSSATVLIKSRKVDSLIEISVEDNGCGIPKEFIGKIFDMFYRASSESPGSGLGLYIAKESANKIKAELRVESIEGEGSKFILTIPENNTAAVNENNVRPSERFSK